MSVDIICRTIRLTSSIQSARPQHPILEIGNDPRPPVTSGLTLDTRHSRPEEAGMILQPARDQQINDSNPYPRSSQPAVSESLHQPQACLGEFLIFWRRAYPGPCTGRINHVAQSSVCGPRGRRAGEDLAGRSLPWLNPPETARGR